MPTDVILPHQVQINANAAPRSVLSQQLLRKMNQNMKENSRAHRFAHVLVKGFLVTNKIAI